MVNVFCKQLTAFRRAISLLSAFLVASLVISFTREAYLPHTQIFIYMLTTNFRLSPIIHLIFHTKQCYCSLLLPIMHLYFYNQQHYYLILSLFIHSSLDLFMLNDIITSLSYKSSICFHFSFHM